MDKVKNYANKILCFLKMYAGQVVQNMYNRKELQQKNQVALQMQSTMLQVRDELFECFHRANYNNLENVVVPANIRVVGWICLKGTILIHYSLSKNNSSSYVLPYVVLQNIQSNMNKDIASTVSELLNMYGYYDMQIYYPYLYKGLYITNVRDLGLDIEIEVRI